MDDVRAMILRAFPHWSSLDLHLGPLDGGITNRNYLVTLTEPGGARRQHVVRVPGERTELLGIDRAHESEAAQRAAGLCLAPPVIGELSEVGTLVTDLVSGVHLSADAFVARLGDVVDLVRRFHQSGPLAGAFPIHRVVEWHARDAVAHGGNLPASFASLHELSMQIEAAFALLPESPVPSHNDLLPANVLFGTNRVWLLDFEYAGMNDRYFDLGNLSVNCAFDTETDQELLRAYFGEFTNRSAARLALMKIMSEFREGMWAVVQQAISTLDTDFVSYADERLDNCLRLAADPQIETTLNDAAK
jgi:thiamine kinase-like enzyme